jgi:hypothetical protein
MFGHRCALCAPGTSFTQGFPNLWSINPLD